MASLDYLLAELATRYGALVGDYSDDPNVHTTPASVGCIPGQTILIDTHSSPEKAYFKNSAGVWVAFGTGTGGGGGSGNMNYAGTWDLTPTLTPTPCLPDATQVAGCSVDVSNPHAVLVTPTAPQVSSLFGSAYACFLGSTAIALDGNEQQVSLIQPSFAGGDTISESVLFFTNSGATLADVEATLAGGAITGTCKFITMVFNSIGTEIEETIAAAGFGVGTMGLSIAGGSPIYVGVNTSTGALSAGDGTGALTAITGTTIPLSDIPGGQSLRMYVGAIGTASTPVYAAGALSYDFSSTHGGAEGLGGATSSDAATPAGATDYSLYKVTAPGSFGGTSAKTGDIVMLYGTMGHIFVFRPPTNITEYTTPADVSAYVATSISSGAIGTAIAAAITAAESGAIATAISAAISSAESGAIATAIASAVSSAVSSAVGTETSRAEGVESSLTASVGGLGSALSDETSRAEAAETALASGIGYITPLPGTVTVSLTAHTRNYHILPYSGVGSPYSTGNTLTVNIDGTTNTPNDGDTIEILGSSDRLNRGFMYLTVTHTNPTSGSPSKVDQNPVVSHVSTAVFELENGRILLQYDAASQNWRPEFVGAAGYTQQNTGAYSGTATPVTGDTVTGVGDAPMFVIAPAGALAALTIVFDQVRLRQAFRIAFTQNIAALSIVGPDNTSNYIGPSLSIPVIATSGVVPTSVSAGDVLEFYSPAGANPIGTNGATAVFYIGKTNYSV